MNIQKYMKNVRLSFTFISLGVLLAFTSIAAIANAQETDSATSSTETNRSAELRSQAEVRRTAIDASRASSATSSAAVRLEAAQERRAEAQAALSIRMQERIVNLAANMSNRMDAAIARLNNIADRMEARATIVASSSGLDTADTIESIALARASLTDAQTLLADIDPLVFDATTSENPREMWIAVRQVYVDARDEIRESHQHLRAALAALKEAVANTGNGVSPAVRQNENASNSSTSRASSTNNN